MKFLIIFQALAALKAVVPESPVSNDEQSIAEFLVASARGPAESLGCYFRTRDPVAVRHLEEFVRNNPKANHHDATAHLDQIYNGSSPLNDLQVYAWWSESVEQVRRTVVPPGRKSEMDEVIDQKCREFFKDNKHGTIKEAQVFVNKALEARNLGSIGYKLLGKRSLRYRKKDDTSEQDNSITSDMADILPPAIAEEEVIQFRRNNPSKTFNDAYDYVQKRFGGKARLTKTQVRHLWFFHHEVPFGKEEEQSISVKASLERFYDEHPGGKVTDAFQFVNDALREQGLGIVGYETIRSLSVEWGLRNQRKALEEAAVREVGEILRQNPDMKAREIYEKMKSNHGGKSPLEVIQIASFMKRTVG